MKKMNMYEAPKAEVIEMQNVSVLMASGENSTPINPGGVDED